MNIQHEIKDGNLAIIELELDKPEVEERYQKELKTVAKTLNMPGFRPGHAPKQLVEQKYGPSVRLDTLNNMVNEGLNNYMNEQKFEFYGMPMSISSKDDQTSPDSMKFKFELGLRPDIQLAVDESVAVKKYNIIVNDEEVIKELELLQRRNGKMEDLDAVDGESLINGDFVELNEEGLPLEGGAQAPAKSILISSIKDEEQKSLFLGKKAGETVSFDIFKTFGDDINEISSIFGITKEAANDLNKIFIFTISKIQKLVPAELDEELFAKFSTDEHPIRSLEDLKEKIRKEIGNYYNAQAVSMMEDDIIRTLVKSHQIKLPDAFLLRWIKEQNKDRNEHDIEHDYLHEKEFLKWSIIRDRIFKEQGLEVSADEIEQQYQLLLGDYMKRFGYDYSMEFIRAEFESKYFKREEQLESAGNIARTQKALDYIKGKVTITEEDIDTKAFDAIRMERSQHAHDHAHDHLIEGDGENEEEHVHAHNH
jgi:trigger factor